MSVDFTVNGEPCSLPEGSKLADLMAELDVGGHAVTIKLNKKTIMQKDWRQEIQEGDHVVISMAIPNSCFTGTHE